MDNEEFVSKVLDKPLRPDNLTSWMAQGKKSTYETKIKATSSGWAQVHFSIHHKLVSVQRPSSSHVKETINWDQDNYVPILLY